MVSEGLGWKSETIKVEEVREEVINFEIMISLSIRGNDVGLIDAVRKSRGDNYLIRDNQNL